MKPKIIAFYLPQYHRIKENDEFWGEGFTDWVTVKNANPVYKGHIQPKIPYNNNYYDLSVAENVLWQSRLAKKYGISAFGVYHYWFNNDKNLLTKPAETMRDRKDIETQYFLVWDNATWKRSWSNVSGNDWAPTIDENIKSDGPKILIPYILGSEPDWRHHYEYVLTHFKSDHYLLIDNKPVFSILNNDKRIFDMCQKWDEWAKEDGYNGILFLFKNSEEFPCHCYRFNYEPHHAAWSVAAPLPQRIWKFAYRLLRYHKRMYYDYDVTWNSLIEMARKTDDRKLFYGAYVAYDDTPRRGHTKGKVVRGASPEKFRKYLKKILEVSVGQNKPYVFLTAWNEWGEGAYLEPDTISGYKYLEAIKSCVDEFLTND